VSVELVDEVFAASGVDVCVVCSAGKAAVAGDVTATASGVVNEVAAAAAARVVEAASASVPTPGVGGRLAAVAISFIRSSKGDASFPGGGQYVITRTSGTVDQNCP
jgi:hypothetical protein